MKSKNVIVTGATGFIGSQVVKQLIADGYRVGILCRENSCLTPLQQVLEEIKIYKTNDNLEKIILAFKEFQPEYVLHLASLFIASHDKQEVEPLITSNLTYGALILEAMKECGITNMINTGTSWQHFNKEDYNPVCLYAATKEAFEKIIDYYVLALGFKALTLTIFDSYGPHDTRGKLISLLKTFAMEGRTLDLSPGDQKMDLTHVEDLAKGYVKAIEYMDTMEPFTHLNFALCSGRTLSLKEVIKIFKEETGYEVKVNWGAKGYRFREVMEPWSSYEILPNWHSTISFEEGVKNLVK